jgi:hypothetical protein
VSNLVLDRVPDLRSHGSTHSGKFLWSQARASEGRADGSLHPPRIAFFWASTMPHVPRVLGGRCLQQFGMAIQVFMQHQSGRS